MATWRSAIEEPPAELLEFRLVDWIGRCEQNPWYYPFYGLGPAYKTPYEMWWLARVDWLSEDHERRIHGMDAIDCLFQDEV